jgi:Domain of unknown function (DUF5710)
MLVARLKMKSDNPPFDPPYVSIRHTEQGVQYVETLADGTQRPVSAAQAGWVQAGASNGGAKAASKSGSPASGSIQSKRFLNVPFAEKDAAKALGARWDATRKKWYVPQGVDANLLSQWLPD